jgi:hypothetical protein
VTCMRRITYRIEKKVSFQPPSTRRRAHLIECVGGQTSNEFFILDCLPALGNVPGRKEPKAPLVMRKKHG